MFQHLMKAEEWRLLGQHVNRLPLHYFFSGFTLPLFSLLPVHQNTIFSPQAPCYQKYIIYGAFAVCVRSPRPISCVERWSNSICLTDFFQAAQKNFRTVEFSFIFIFMAFDKLSFMWGTRQNVFIYEKGTVRFVNEWHMIVLLWECVGVHDSDRQHGISFQFWIQNQFNEQIKRVQIKPFYMEK